MTYEQRQRLSAIADNAAGYDRASAMLADIEQTPELRDYWQRCHLIGSALRGEPVHSAYCVIGDRVRAAITHEQVAVRISVIDRLRGWLSAAGLRPGLLLPAYGGAAAAVLAVGIVGLGLLSSDGSKTADIAAVEPNAWTDGTLTAQAGALLRDSTSPRWQATSPALSSKLDRMLVGHRESAAASGIKGFIPYAAVVGNGVR